MEDATKRCARCGQTKPRTEFRPNSHYSDGLWSYCYECKRQCDKESYARNRATRSAAASARYQADPEPAKRRARLRYDKDPGRVVAEVARWQAANREKVRAYNRGWSKRNPEKKREYVRARYALRKGAPVIRFTRAQLDQRLAFYDGLCWICRGAADSVDHVKPLAKGGWHCLSNLRPICRVCNSRKGDIWPYPAIGGNHARHQR